MTSRVRPGAGGEPLQRASISSTVGPRSVDQRLVAPGPLGRVVLLRALLTVVIGLRLVLRRWWVMADRPDDLFLPVPVLRWLSEPPGTTAIWAVWLVGLAAVAASLVLSVPVLRGRPATRPGRYVGIPFAVAWLSLVVLAGLWGSSGKILHNDILLISLCAPVLLAPAPRPGDRATDVDHRWGWPARAALAVLGTVYFLTGFQKLRHSGLEWVFSSNMSWVLRQGNPRISEDLSRSIADQQWLTQGLAGGALLLELGAPLLLAIRRTRLLFAAGAAAMHLSIWAFLGLDYYGWVLTVWAVVVPSTWLGDRVLGQRTTAATPGADRQRCAGSVVAMGSTERDTVQQVDGGDVPTSSRPESPTPKGTGAGANVANGRP